MRGVILAGGSGTRLGLSTKTVNKHCFPVCDRPMVLWPLGVLTDNDIRDVTIVSTPVGVGQISAMLGSGTSHGCELTYRVQDSAGGIAAALACADDRSDRPIVVILGDNVFLPPPKLNPRYYVDPVCYLREVEESRLHEFGVAQFKSNVIDGATLTAIVEKPAVPPSNFAVTGLYRFNADVFAVINNLKRSLRGEYEISDLLNCYARDGALDYEVVRGGAFWGDAGTYLGLMDCAAACRKYLEGQS